MVGQNIFEDLLGLPFQFELVFRIILACVAGAIIGYERKKREKVAGMRTHILAAMASCVFSICSKYSYFDILAYQGMGVDASRIAANIVTGICFLGAGAVFIKSKSVIGLTTAAGIWAVSGVGMCLGNGMYIIGGASMLLMIIIQYTLHNKLNHIEGAQPQEFTFVLKDGEKHIDEFLEELKKADQAMRVSALAKEPDGKIVLKVSIHPYAADIYKDVWSFMKRYTYVISCNL